MYHRGDAVSPIVIGLLLLLVTSPAEEIFWRGFIQRTTVEKLGPVWGLIITTILYGAVHIWTFNITLIIAALVAGLFWGLMYLKLSHADKSRYIGSYPGNRFPCPVDLLYLCSFSYGIMGR